MAKLNLHYVTGMKLVHPCCDPGATPRATLEIQTTDGVFALRLFGETLSALMRIKVEVDPEDVDRIRAVLKEEQAVGIDMVAFAGQVCGMGERKPMGAA